MRKTLRSLDHAELIGMLKAERKRAGLTQQQVADALGVPQSYVAKYEGGERRLDVLEFIAVVQAIGADPVKMLEKLL